MRPREAQLLTRRQFIDTSMDHYSKLNIVMLKPSSGASRETASSMTPFKFGAVRLLRMRGCKPDEEKSMLDVRK